MEARIKTNGGIVKDKLAEVFIKIGIAEELQEEEPVDSDNEVVAEPVAKQQLKVTKVKQRSKTKRGRPAKK